MEIEGCIEVTQATIATVKRHQVDFKWTENFATHCALSTRNAKPSDRFYSSRTQLFARQTSDDRNENSRYLIGAPSVELECSSSRLARVQGRVMKVSRLTTIMNCRYIAAYLNRRLGRTLRKRTAKRRHRDIAADGPPK